VSVHASHEALTLHSPVACPGLPWLALARPAREMRVFKSGMVWLSVKVSLERILDQEVHVEQTVVKMSAMELAHNPYMSWERISA
jgi:hypothetical protein